MKPREGRFGSGVPGGHAFPIGGDIPDESAKSDLAESATRIPWPDEERRLKD